MFMVCACGVCANGQWCRTESQGLARGATERNSIIAASRRDARSDIDDVAALV
jgi:hypothetical protein